MRINVLGRDLVIPASTPNIWRQVIRVVSANLSPEMRRRAGPIPDPLTCRVRYRREPRRLDGGVRDEYRTWVQVLADEHDGWGTGDCEDFAAWLTAYLIQEGKPARVAISENAGGGWHAMVAIPSPGSKLPKNTYIGPDLGFGAKGWKLLDPAWRFGMPRGVEGYHPEATSEQREKIRGGE